jgi:predicted DNA-binding transcriptional regulator AlpA
MGVEMENTEFLNTKAAAAFCGMSAATFETKRVRGGGPRFHRPRGTRRVVYHRADLREWMGEPLTSTSDKPAEVHPS